MELINLEPMKSDKSNASEIFTTIKETILIGKEETQLVGSIC